MSVILSQHIRINRGLWVSNPINLDPKTNVITLSVSRPTLANPRVKWVDGDAISVAIIIEIDGVEYRCDGGATGGQRVSSGVQRIGQLPEEIAAYTLRYELPWGFFGNRKGAPKRLGERAQSSYRVRLEIFGTSDTLVELSQSSADAPDVPFSSSVAFDAASSVIEVSGDGVVSWSHTATGSNRAAFVAGDFYADGPSPSAGTSTYAGNAGTGLYSLVGAYSDEWFAGRYYIESQIPTGPQIVTSTFTSSGYNNHAAGVISVTGVNQATPVTTHQTSKGTTGTTPSITVTGMTTGDLVVDALGAWSSSGNPSVGADQTERTSQDPAGSYRFQMSTQPGASGGVMSWSKSSDWDFSLGGVAFLQSVETPVKNSIFLGCEF